MINKLPRLTDPAKYAGLYIFDFGDRVAVGYTAEEIEFLLADGRYAGGGVYKIYRAHPDGTLEIRGVNPLLWNLAAGIVFWFHNPSDANAAFDRLRELAAGARPPGEFDLILVQKPGNDPPYALVMRYNQELDDAFASWLLRVQYNLGDFIEAGVSLVNQTIAGGTEMRHSRLGVDAFRKSRTRLEVLGAVDRPVQR
jgi:hypothetical protein